MPGLTGVLLLVLLVLAARREVAIGEEFRSWNVVNC